MGFALGCDPFRIGLSWASFPVVSRTWCAQPPATLLSSLRLAEVKEAFSQRSPKGLWVRADAWQFRREGLWQQPYCEID